jgi:Uncharacterized membrane protein (homolog of Drosophila rhomboid)
MKSSLKQAKKSIRYSAFPVLIFWIISGFEYLTRINLNFLGIYPRQRAGLPGIITAPFIHADWEHLLANTLPFLILSTLLFFFYNKKAFSIYILIWLTGGILTWLIGRPAWHIGASILIYALAFFLFFGGIFSRKWQLITVSGIIGLFYGSMVWGIFPNDTGISWEGHLSGALSGTFWAYIFRKSLRKEKQYI